MWYFFFIPETKGRTLEEIDELFEKRVPTGQFVRYRTSILDQVLRDVQNRRLNGTEKTSVTVVEEGAEPLAG